MRTTDRVRKVRTSQRDSSRTKAAKAAAIDRRYARQAKLVGREVRP